MKPFIKYLDYYIVSICALMLFFVRFLYADNDFYYFYADDFFYYLQIAKNIAINGVSTFNGIVETNGYHPLWQDTLALFYKLFNAKGTFYLVAIVQTLSAVLSYHLLKRIFSKYIEENLSIFSSMFIYITIILMTKSGMETILTIPLMLYAIYLYIYQSEKILKITIILTFMMLSRLDSVILAALIYLALAIKNKFSFKFVLHVLIGSIPVILYLTYNYISFEHFMPVSGAAKQLKSSPMPAWNSILGILNVYPGKIIYGLVPMILMIISLLHLAIKRKNVHKELIVLPLFPIIVLFYYSFSSGWNMWSWYYYIFIPSTIYFFIAFSFISKKYGIFLKYSAVLCVFGWISLNVYTKKAEKDPGYQRMMDMIEFMNDKNGIVAMGDAAGMPGYLLKNPIVQLEGLVMDFDYLEMIKKGELEDIFKKYKVDYYITISSTKENEMWKFTEPWDHHKYIINTTMTTKQQPIYSSGENWMDFRIWDVRYLRE
jgi:hypothetical protein